MKKNKLLLIGLLILPLYGDLSIGRMETMVEKIKAKREGANIKRSKHFTSPFVMIQKDEGKVVMGDPKSTNIVFVLGAIINNKVFLNKTWLSVGDTLEGYRLVSIKESMVTLRQEERIIKVFLKKKKSILQLNERD